MLIYYVANERLAYKVDTGIQSDTINLEEILPLYIH